MHHKPESEPTCGRLIPRSLLISRAKKSQAELGIVAPCLDAREVLPVQVPFHRRCDEPSRTCACSRERIVIGLTTSDRKLKAFRKGSK